MPDAATIDTSADAGAAARAAATAAISGGKPATVATDAGKTTADTGTGAGTAAKDAARTAQADALAADAAKTKTGTADAVKPDDKAGETAAPSGLEETLLSDTPTHAADAKAGDDAAAKAAKEAAAKPTDYTLAAPEGKNAKGETVKLLDPAYVKGREAFFKQSGLNEAQAKAMLASDVAQIRRFANDLRAQTVAHPELGGDNMDATIARTKSVLTTHFTAEQRASIAKSPLANHWMLHKLCQLVDARTPKEDNSPHGGGQGGNKRDPTFAEAMWPHLFAGKS